VLNFAQLCRAGSEQASTRAAVSPCLTLHWSTSRLIQQPEEHSASRCAWQNCQNSPVSTLQIDLCAARHCWKVTQRKRALR